MVPWREVFQIVNKKRAARIRALRRRPKSQVIRSFHTAIPKGKMAEILKAARRASLVTIEQNPKGKNSNGGHNLFYGAINNACSRRAKKVDVANEQFAYLDEAGNPLGASLDRRMNLRGIGAIVESVLSLAVRDVFQAEKIAGHILAHPLRSNGFSHVHVGGNHPFLAGILRKYGIDASDRSIGALQPSYFWRKTASALQLGRSLKKVTFRSGNSLLFDSAELVRLLRSIGPEELERGALSEEIAGRLASYLFPRSPGYQSQFQIRASNNLQRVELQTLRRINALRKIDPETIPELGA